MTRNEIKTMMLELIQENLRSEVSSIEDLITADDVHKFMWSKDFGQWFIDAYLDNYKKDLINAYLEEIYDEFDVYDLESPF